MGVLSQSEYPQFIGGAWQKSDSRKTIDVVNPANGELLARTAAGNEADVNAAVASARQAFDSWGGTSPMERQGILLEIAARIQRRARDYALMETLNVGKPIRESTLIDVPLAIDHFRYFAGMTRHVHGLTQVVDGTTLNFTLREPLGVVGTILPWNFPLLLIAWKLAPALAAGNTVVMKPAEQTPLSALELANDLRDLLPAGVFNVVTGYGPDVGAPLVGEWPSAAATSWRGPASMSSSATDAPASTRARAVAAPTPFAAPVTRTTLPSNRSAGAIDSLV